MKVKSFFKIPEHLSINFCDISFLIYMCVLFAHQLETPAERILRYGSWIFVLICFLLENFIFFDKNKKLSWKTTTLEQWLTIFFLYVVLTMLWAIDAHNSMTIIISYIKVFSVVIVVAPNLDSREKIEHYLMLILIALVYMNVLLLLKTPVSTLGTDRIGEAIGQHSNEIGRCAALGALLCFSFLQKGKNRVVLIGLMGMFCVISLLTGSKNAIFIMIFQLGLYYYLSSGNVKKIFVILGIILGICAIWYLIFTNEILYNLVGSRMEGMINGITGKTLGDASTSERIFFIKTAFGLFLSHPIFGVGAYNFSSYLKTIGYLNAVYSHCGFVELLSTTGLIGFAIYYSIYFIVGNRLRKANFKQDLIANVFFVTILRIFIFDFSTISAYFGYNYVFIMLACRYADCININIGRKRLVYKI